MPNELASWNAPSVALLRALLAQTTPFTLQLAGTPISVRLQRTGSAEWPSPAPIGLTEAGDGPWPETLEVHAEWAGGATSLRFTADVAALRAHGGAGDLHHAR